MLIYFAEKNTLLLQMNNLPKNLRGWNKTPCSKYVSIKEIVTVYEIAFDFSGKQTFKKSLCYE